MSRVRRCSTFILLLYLQSALGQQVVSNNQNAASNNGFGRTNNMNQIPNGGYNMNQIPNGGYNMNIPQQTCSQNNLQSNLQQMNVQQQNANAQVTNRPMAKQGLNQCSKDGTNPIVAHIIAALQAKHGGTKQNAQMPSQQNTGPNLSEVSNIPSSTSLSDLAGLKGQALISLLSQGNGGYPQNQQITGINQNLAQNQLTDAQKQYLVKSLQSQVSPQSQQAMNIMQPQTRPADIDYLNSIQGQVMMSQPQAITVTPTGNQPAYITVQAQPLSSYLQSPPIKEDDQSMLSMILSELQPSDPQYNVYNTGSNKGSKSNLKALIPLIINLLKEKNCCGCHNNCCPSNGQNNVLPDPMIFSGYANQMNYSQGNTVPTATEKHVGKENQSSSKHKKFTKKIVESEESEEDDSEYIDVSEES